MKTPNVDCTLYYSWCVSKITVYIFLFDYLCFKFMCNCYLWRADVNLIVCSCQHRFAYIILKNKPSSSRCLICDALSCSWHLHHGSDSYYRINCFEQKMLLNTIWGIQQTSNHLLVTSTLCTAISQPQNTCCKRTTVNGNRFT